MQREGGKVIVFFVDFRTAFDSLDRKLLWKALEERGISKELRERIREVYEKTIYKVKVGRKIGEAFWTAKEVRQGYPLIVNAKLFTLMLAD